MFSFFYHHHHCDFKFCETSELNLQDNFSKVMFYFLLKNETYYDLIEILQLKFWKIVPNKKRQSRARIVSAHENFASCDRID